MAEGRILHGTRRALWTVMVFVGAMALSAVVVAAAGAQSEEKGSLREYEVPVSSPEGVFYDAGTRAFYGGSAGDGEIYKAKLDGARLKKARTFMPIGEDAQGNPDSRNAAHGLNVDEEGRLYIAGVLSGELHVYQLPKGRKIATVETGPGGYINDVDFAPNGDVYFTDSNRPIMWRVTEEQIEAGGTIDDPQAIPLEPEVDYTPSTRTTVPLEANGIRFTPNGKYIIFNSINNGELYRMTPPPANDPEARRIITVGGITPAELGNTDGLEFLNSNILYSMDNSGEAGETAPGADESPERLVKLRFSDNYTQAKVTKETTNDSFHTPATISLAPNDRVLISNLELFDPDEDNPDPQTSIVTSIRRP